MTRHVLKTSGAWVEMRDVEDLRARDRKKIDALMARQVTVDVEGDVSVDRGAVFAIMRGIPEAVAALLVSAWEIPYAPDAQLPSIDPEVLDDLRLDDYNRLLELAEPAVKLFMPGRSNNPDDHTDPASPSGPASG